jgi:hypothetical protein
MTIYLGDVQRARISLDIYRATGLLLARLVGVPAVCDVFPYGKSCTRLKARSNSNSPYEVALSSQAVAKGLEILGEDRCGRV